MEFPNATEDIFALIFDILIKEAPIQMAFTLSVTSRFFYGLFYARLPKFFSKLIITKEYSINGIKTINRTLPNKALHGEQTKNGLGVESSKLYENGQLLRENIKTYAGDKFQYAQTEYSGDLFIKDRIYTPNDIGQLKTYRITERIPGKIHVHHGNSIDYDVVTRCMTNYFFLFNTLITYFRRVMTDEEYRSISQHSPIPL